MPTDNTIHLAASNNGVLESLERQISLLKDQLQRKNSVRPFKEDLEQTYLQDRTRRFLSVELGMLLGGLFFYFLFSWSDIALGGDNAHRIMSARASIALFLFIFLLAIPKTQYREHIFVVAAAGITICGLSIIYFLNSTRNCNSLSLG